MYKKLKLILFVLIFEAFIINVQNYALQSNEEKEINQEEKFEKEISLEKNGNKVFVSRKYKECPKNIRCVPQIQCPAHVRMKPREKPQKCDLPYGRHGFCCLTGQNHTASIRDKRSIGVGDELDYIEEARSMISSMMERPNANLKVEAGQPEFYHSLMFHSSPEEVMKNVELSNAAIEQVIASQILREKENIPIKDFETNRVDVDLYSNRHGMKGAPPQQHYCPSKTSARCPNYGAKYRSHDGSCNNPIPNRALWGAAGQPFERLLPPNYEDGIWEPRRTSVDGSRLQSAREISRKVLPDRNRPHPRYNLMLMQFGQFIAHDVTQSRSFTLPNGDPVQCCSPDGSQVLLPNESHFACLGIPISREDEFYRKFNQRCMNFVRLSLAPMRCKAGYARQQSQVTHYLDGSPIYGSNLNTANSLRSFRGGKLNMLNEKGHDLLPLTNNRTVCRQVQQGPGSTCFLAGDTRVNQIISLIAVHILFAREHNRIAEILSAINPKFSDEQLYQEARRIVIAEFQHITYNEYVPAVIGTETMQRFSLSSGYGHSSDYNPDVNPAVTNEFSGAAFRFGHSTVDGAFRIQRGTSEDVINIPDVMFNPDRLRQRTFFDHIVRTLTEQPMQQFDNAVSVGLTRFLFRGNRPFGMDLASLNIQRGNDQGLRTYNHYLEVMGHHRITSFNAFSEEVGKRLSSAYRHPDDIDLWVGGLLELSFADSLVGPTFAEIIADQFSRLRHGDRYFYENGPDVNPGHFTTEQLNEIRKSSMASVICENIDYFATNEVSPLAFLIPDVKGNHPVRCDSKAIPRPNLNAWRY